ncbi:MAG TPA: hypothetical protein VJ654_04400, partial [Noviherbaspirillum sp.]|nr:hypothetical protein [Noviherbaspirillum sp.]
QQQTLTCLSACYSGLANARSIRSFYGRVTRGHNERTRRGEKKRDRLIALKKSSVCVESNLVVPGIRWTF